MDIDDCIVDGRLKISVKTNAPKTRITDYDKENKTIKLDVHAHPEKGKANAEIIKFFSRLAKKKVRIISGLASKKKVLIFS
jgi:uncharacterized protein (TIGR00251 family)